MTGQELTAQESKELESQADLATDSKLVCQNCKTPLTGPFCHQCGQPNKSIIRFFGSLIQELLEDVLAVDSRATRTLSALIFRPGFLTNEYLAGRRFFYVPPLRLFLITSIVCIFTIWVLNKTSNTSEDSIIQINDERELSDDRKQEILASLTDKPLSELSESERVRVREKLDGINKGLKFADQNASIIEIPAELLTEAERQLINDQTAVEDREKLDTIENGQSPPDQVANDAANKLNDDLQKQSSKPEEKQPLTCENHSGLNFQNEKALSCFSFLSEEDNQKLSERFTEAVQDFKDPEERKDFLGDLLEIVPKVMLLLVPVFAILMKVLYPFSRRYYIEHLIHAFHGHAFLFLGILLSILFELGDIHFSSSENWVISNIGHLFGLLEILILVYIPIYFVISFRKVYRQNWFLTLFKSFLLALLYFILFTISAVMVVIISVLLG